MNARSLPMSSTQPAVAESNWTMPIFPTHASNDAVYFERRGLSRRALRRALAFIHEHLCERFTLEAVAGAAGVSRHHFARQFRISTRFSPMVYQMHVRIERSKEMLARGDRSICDIAAALGFCDQSHFTRTFRRMTGLAPRDYAHQCEEPTEQRRDLDESERVRHCTGI
jgi:AraC family transcriptional regulator